MLIQLFVVALAVAALSHTVSRAKVFAGVRRWVANRSDFLGTLFSCAYCLSHWFAAFLVSAVRIRPFDTWLPLDLFISALAVVTLASFFIGGIRLVYPAAKPPEPEPMPLPSEPPIYRGNPMEMWSGGYSWNPMWPQQGGRSWHEGFDRDPPLK